MISLFCFMVILFISLTVKCLTGYVLVTTGFIKLGALVIIYYILDGTSNSMFFLFLVILSISLTVIKCLTGYVLLTTGVIKLGTGLNALVVIYYIILHSW